MDEVRQYIENIVTPAKLLEVAGAEVNGSGADATSNSLLARYIQPILDAETVDDLSVACARVQTSLNYLGVFQDAQLSLAKSGTTFNKPELMAQINLLAAKRFTVATGTNVGNQEGYGYIKGTTRNYFGLGETLNLDLHVGTRTTKSNLATISAPGAWFKLPIEYKAEFLGYDSSKKAEWALHQQEVRGVTVRLASMLHSLGVDAVLRTLYSDNIKTLASPTFCQQAGHALKLAAFFNYTRDTRDNPFLASRGSLIRVANEVAVGDNPMLKVAVDLQRAWSLTPWLSSSLTGRLGYLYSSGPSHLMDRFYMGGSTDLRGFAMNSVGPQEGAISVGGNCLAVGGLSLFSKIPRATEALKFHVFGNVGSLDNDWSQLSRPRVSAGFGLVYNHPISRFELNISMPLVAHQSDKCSKGLQLGIGMSYI